MPESRVVESIPVKPMKNAKCPACGTLLKIRKFVDATDDEGKPCDINEDFHCVKCNIRWYSEAGPHVFYEEAKEK